MTWRRSVARICLGCRDGFLWSQSRLRSRSRSILCLPGLQGRHSLVPVLVPNLVLVLVVAVQVLVLVLVPVLVLNLFLAPVMGVAAAVVMVVAVAMTVAVVVAVTVLLTVRMLVLTSDLTASVIITRIQALGIHSVTSQADRSSISKRQT